MPISLDLVVGELPVSCSRPGDNKLPDSNKGRTEPLIVTTTSNYGWFIHKKRSNKRTELVFSVMAYDLPAGAQPVAFPVDESPLMEEIFHS